MKRAVVLSIAGSDSSGGAGIQADLRVFSKLGVFGTTAITAITAQNLSGVQKVESVSADTLKKQIRAIFEGFPIAAIKTGMLWSAENVSLVASLIEEWKVSRVVVDPVMVATSGACLLEEEAVGAYREVLFPKALVMTPNLDEAQVLLNETLSSVSDMKNAAGKLSGTYGCACLVKGGHLKGHPVDILFHEKQWHVFEHKRIQNVNSHGTGCMLSAAITAYLALGESLVKACGQAIAFVEKALQSPIALDHGENISGIENVW